jgi:hypothetical protein
LAVVPVAAQAEVVPEVYANRTLVGLAPTATLAWGELKLHSGAVGEVKCKNAFALGLWNKSGRGEGAFEGWGTNDCTAPELEEAFKLVTGKTVTVFAGPELPVEEVPKEGIVCSEPADTKPSQCPNASEKETRKDLLGSVHRRNTSFPWNVELKRVAIEGEQEIVSRIGIGAEGKTCYPTEVVENEEGGPETIPASWEKVPAGCVKIDLVAPQIPDEVIFYGQLQTQWVNGSKTGLYPSRLEFTSESGELVSSKGSAAETEVLGELRVLGYTSLQLMLAK